MAYLDDHHNNEEELIVMGDINISPIDLEDDLAERRPDNDTDCHVNDIAPHGEFLEFFKHFNFLRLMDEAI